MSRQCGNTKTYAPGEIPLGEHPCCDKCGMPMVAVKVVVQKPKKARR